MTEKNDNPTNRSQYGRKDRQNDQISDQTNQNNQIPDSSLDQPDPDPDLDQYGNLDEPQMDLYGDLEEQEMARYSDPDAEAQDQYGPQNPIGSADEPDTPGGLGLYDIQDQYGNDHDLVQPGSDKDQYGTRGSQDQYGDQQNIK